MLGLVCTNSNAERPLCLCPLALHPSTEILVCLSPHASPIQHLSAPGVLGVDACGEKQRQRSVAEQAVN